MQSVYLCFFIFLFYCDSNVSKQVRAVSNSKIVVDINPYPTIDAIPLPAGFTKVYADSSSFGNWLRKLQLKKNKTVYKFNGLPKENQTAQFAVVDISVGDKDLQQCADAVMRMRAEYLYQQRKFSSIDFIDNNYTHYRLQFNANRTQFDAYLKKIFSYCGTASLDKQLVPVNNFTAIKAGDVLVQAGGHAMMVMNIAINKNGKKIYLLSQSSMPAQDIHVVVNPANAQLSPWYEVNTTPVIETPEWTFIQKNLKSWPEDK